MPALKLEDGSIIGESMNILRMLAQKHGFYPEDPLEAAQVDEYLDAFDGVIPKFAGPFFMPENQRETGSAELFSTIAPTFLKALDGAFSKGGFMVGDKLTAADFVIGGLYTNYFNNQNVGYCKDKFEAVRDAHPNFKAYGDRFTAEMKSYLDSRPSCPI